MTILFYIAVALMLPTALRIARIRDMKKLLKEQGTIHDNRNG